MLIFDRLQIIIRMRNSNSKQRQPNPQSYQQRNAKTSQSNRTPMAIQNVNLNLPLTVKKDDNKKQLPPKPPQKVEYNVDINMTQSKIFQAKQGLQLLKKKMNRTGLSREKAQSQTQSNTERELQKLTINKAVSNKQDRKEAIVSSKAVTKSSKGLQPQEGLAERNHRSVLTNQSKQPKNSFRQGLNEEERPISNQVDFMQLLEREMQKSLSTKNKPVSSYNLKVVNSNAQEVILQTCQMGCGRNFNPETIVKHEKICYKVFQSKRKAFNSAAFRQPKVEGYSAPTITSKIQQKVKPKNEVPKWKIESAQLRAGLKLAKKVPLSKEQEKLLALQQELKQCPYCGRKFSQKAAIKHISFCQKKSKQMPKKGYSGRK